MCVCVTRTEREREKCVSECGHVYILVHVCVYVSFEPYFYVCHDEWMKWHDKNHICVHERFFFPLSLTLPLSLTHSLYLYDFAFFVVVVVEREYDLFHW